MPSIHHRHPALRQMVTVGRIHRNPDIAPGERIERVRCRLDLRGASPEWIVKDAEAARTRTPELIAARYLGVSVGYHVFARPT